MSVIGLKTKNGTESTVTASALEPQQGNIFYWAFIRSTTDRPN